MTDTAITKIMTLNNISEWNKKDLAQLAHESVAEVAENGGDTLALLAMAAKLEHYAGEVKKAAKQRGINDLAKFGKGGTMVGGVALMLKETGVTYDYSADHNWLRINGEIERLDEHLTLCENRLKATPPEGIIMTDELTGELYKAYPPVRTARESIQATIK